MKIGVFDCKWPCGIPKMDTDCTIPKGAGKDMGVENDPICFAEDTVLEELISIGDSQKRGQLIDPFSTTAAPFRREFGELFFTEVPTQTQRRAMIDC